MKMIIIKIIVIAIAIASVAAVVALFTKNKYTLSRTAVIDRPVDQVYDYIKLNANQHSYSKWLSLDPNTNIELKGAPDGTPGAILAFSSNDRKAGTGEWETKRLQENERIDFELRFLKPFEFTANGSFTTESIPGERTKITWVYNSGMDWPMNFMLLFLNMDQLVGNDIQASLVSLKHKLEQ
jgi:hypothetical protein